MESFLNDAVKLIYQCIAKKWILMKIRAYCLEEQKRFEVINTRLSAPLSIAHHEALEKEKDISSSKAIAYHVSYFALKKVKMDNSWFEKAEKTLKDIDTKIPENIHSAESYSLAIHNCYAILQCAMIFK